MENFDPKYVPPAYIGVDFFRRTPDWSSRVIHDTYQVQQMYKLGMSPRALVFGEVRVEEKSKRQKIEVANLGWKPLTIEAIRGVGDFVVSHNAPLVLAPLARFEIYVTFDPQRLGVATGGVYVDCKEASDPEFCSFIGLAVGDGPGPELDIDKAMDALWAFLQRSTGDAAIAANIPVLTTKEGLVKNNMFVGGALGGYTADGAASSEGIALVMRGIAEAWEQDQDPKKLEYIKFLYEGLCTYFFRGEKPTTSPSQHWDHTWLVNAGSRFNVLGPLYVPGDDGPGPEPEPGMGRVYAQGSQFYRIIDGKKKPIRLKGMNWYGMEGDIGVVQGLWARNWKTIVDELKGRGFNLLRLPMSTPTLEAGRMPKEWSINFDLNPDLVGKSVMEVLDTLLDYCLDKSIYVILDHHSNGSHVPVGQEGSPVTADHTFAMWRDWWLQLANRYKNHFAVIGADLHNEPWDVEYTQWAEWCEQVGDSIHALAPEWIIFVEGCKTVTDPHAWWGGDLSWVRTRPVQLARPNKLAYAPHEYGHSANVNSWLRSEANPNQPVNWPENLVPLWDMWWGFIPKEGIAPLYLGEVGGRFGIDDNGNITVPNAQYEKEWFNRLTKYLNMEDFNPDTEFQADTTTRLGMSWSWWCYPPGGDTGGVVLQDWITPVLEKYTLMAPILSGGPVYPGTEQPDPTPDNARVLPNGDFRVLPNGDYRIFKE